MEASKTKTSEEVHHGEAQFQYKRPTRPPPAPHQRNLEEFKADLTSESSDVALGWTLTPESPTVSSPGTPPPLIPDSPPPPPVPTDLPPSPGDQGPEAEEKPVLSTPHPLPEDVPPTPGTEESMEEERFEDQVLFVLKTEAPQNVGRQTIEEDIECELARVLSTAHRDHVLATQSEMKECYSTLDHLELKTDELSAKTIKRKASAMEILQTERSYVQSLKLVIDVVITPARNEGILTYEELHGVFSVLENIYAINVELLKRLEDAMKHYDEDETMVGGIFLEFAPYFKSYSQYCDNYDKALNLNNSLHESNPRWKACVDSLYHHSESKRLTLHMYLIMPVQRIPRYHLLLSALYEYTDPRHKDYGQIEKAIAALKSVAATVDHSVRNAENRAYVMQISQQLVNFREDFVLIEPHRLHIKTGVLSKVNKTDGLVVNRVFYLFNDIILVAAPVGSSMSVQTVDKVIPLVTAWVIDKPEAAHPNTFWLASPNSKTLEILAHSPAEKRHWMQAINDAILDLIINNQHLAEERESNVMAMSADGIPEFMQSTSEQNNNFSFVRHSSIKKFLSGSLKVAVQTIAPDMLATPATTSTISPRPAPTMVTVEGYKKEDEFVLLDAEKMQPCPVIDVEGVRYMSGCDIVRMDARHSKIPSESMYLFMEGSYNYIFGRSIGYIGIRNNSETEACTLASWQLFVNAHRPSFFVLKAAQQACFDFKGDWCIEIVQADKKNLEIFAFETSGGTGSYNWLNMV